MTRLARLWDSLTPRERFALAYLAECPEFYELARLPWAHLRDQDRAQLMFGARLASKLGELAGAAVRT